MARADSFVRVNARSNAQFKMLRSLAGSAKDRRVQRRTLLDGPHLVSVYIDRCGAPRLLAVTESALVHPEVASLLERLDRCPVLCLAPELFQQIAPVESPVGILALIDTPPAHRETELGQLVVMLEGIQDPGNVGTIIRSAAAAGANDLLLSRGCADAWAPRTLRAAMGAHFAIRIHTDVDLLGAARRFSGIRVATASANGVRPDALDLRGRVALLFGSEGAGLSEALASEAEFHLSIPMARGVESLNVGAAAAIVLFERVRQLASPKRMSTARVPRSAGDEARRRPAQ